MEKKIERIERICWDRWDLWVCVKYSCKASEVNPKDWKVFEKQILDIVNNCKTDYFYNKHHGNRPYTVAENVCECGDDPEYCEHWILE